MLLCIVLAVSVYFWDQDRVRKRANHPDGIWTITMDGKAASYTFRGPLDTFLIHRTEVTSLRKLTADVRSLTMQWHYETGEPWRRWERDNPEKNENDDQIKLSAEVDTVPADKDLAAQAEDIHLDHVINSTNPAQNAKLVGQVWNDTALKYERRYDTHYLIVEREPYDGRVIACDTGPWYCSLHGARVNDTLELGKIMVWKQDVENWKQYQDKARALVEKAIVE